MGKHRKQTATPSYTAAQAVARLNQPAGVRRDGLADRRPGFWRRLFRAVTR